MHTKRFCVGFSAVAFMACSPSFRADDHPANSGSAGGPASVSSAGEVSAGGEGLQAGGGEGLQAGAERGLQAGAGSESGGASALLPSVVPAYTSAAAKIGINSNKGTRNTGRQFVVTGSSIRVRDLGVFDNGANGLAAEHTVTLFSLEKPGPGAKATPVAGGSLTVPAGTVAQLDAGFRYASLSTPVTLATGNYAVVAYGLNDVDGSGDGGGLPLPSLGVSDAHFDPYEFVTVASPAFPVGGDTNSHSSASFRFESTLKPLRIMPLGSANTVGLQGTQAGYRGPLKKLLDDAAVLFQYVGSATDNPGTVPLPREQQHHEGHANFLVGPGSSGQANLLGSFDEWLGPGGSDVDVFLIMAGTDEAQLDFEPEGATARIEQLVDAILDPITGFAPKAAVIMAQLPPIGELAADERCQDYNRKILSVVQAHHAKGEAISTVDMHVVVALTDLADETHPNDVGYAKMAKAWFEALQASGALTAR